MASHSPWFKLSKERQQEILRQQRKRRREAPHLSRAGCKRWRRKLRETVIAAYGGKCACCGETRREFLTIDHKNGDGAAHRRTLVKPTHKRRVPSGHVLYVWLKRQGFPVGFQVLCWNCNCAKGYYGACPHSETPAALARSTNA